MPPFPAMCRIVKLMAGGVTLITRHEGQFNGRPKNTSFYFFVRGSRHSPMAYFNSNYEFWDENNQEIGIPVFDY